jgi:hypothetical protein
MWCNDSDKYLKKLFESAEKLQFLPGVKNLIQEAFYLGCESVFTEMQLQKKAIEALEKKKNDPVQNS